MPAGKAHVTAANQSPPFIPGARPHRGLERAAGQVRVCKWSRPIVYEMAHVGI